MKEIELKYKMEGDAPQLRCVKYFKTWKSLDKFILSQKLKKWKVKGESATRPGEMINYTSVKWEQYER